MEDTPTELEAAGQALWRSVLELYELTPAELEILRDAAAERDLIAALDSQWKTLGRPVTSRGSMGQEVAHPLVSELRQHRSALRQLLSALKLPSLDSDGAEVVPLDRPMTRSEVGKLGAATRWAR